MPGKMKKSRVGKEEDGVAIYATFVAPRIDEYSENTVLQAMKQLFPPLEKPSNFRQFHLSANYLYTPSFRFEDDAPDTSDLLYRQLDEDFTYFDTYQPTFQPSDSLNTEKKGMLHKACAEPMTTVSEFSSEDFTTDSCDTKEEYVCENEGSKPSKIVSQTSNTENHLNTDLT